VRRIHRDTCHFSVTFAAQPDGLPISKQVDGGPMNSTGHMSEQQVVPRAGMGGNSFWLLLLGALALLGLGGCTGMGPQALDQTRLSYNEVVKRTSEEQLLLNIVRLRYTDTPSSMAVSSIAAQFERVQSAQLMPFFAATGGDNNRGSYAAVLPMVQLQGADRPTFSLTPEDDQEFTRKLFTPLTLEGVIYLAKTTWPISTVFRLYLENLNWVSNAQTASGPTPKKAPEVAEFLRGMAILQLLQDRAQIVFGVEEREEQLGGSLPADAVKAADLVTAAQNSLEYRQDDKGRWRLVKKTSQPVIRVDPQSLDSPEVAEFVRVFRLKPGMAQYDITQEALNPFPSTYPSEGVTSFDLETRSLLQALYYVAHGVAVPAEHAAQGLATVTREADGSEFDWAHVMRGFFHVYSVRPDSGHADDRPARAHVAVRYKDYWYYIDDTDQDTKATFSLLMELARLELAGKNPSGPQLTLPIGK
jgi:hypothetical protein